MPTEKLFMKDAYIKEFDANIIKIIDNKIILDRTAFFAESGGQVGDTGFLNNTRIIDTKYDDKEITHIVEHSELKGGEKVIGRIDWDRRYKIMKHHAASHIMEYFLYKIFGQLKLIGTHVNEKHDSSTYEYHEIFDQEKLKQVEKLANEFILNGYKIERWEDLKKKGWWYWKAGDIVMACGGTHPTNVKEINKISLKRKSDGKGRLKIITSIIE